MTERHGERRDRPMDEPAPTLTSKSGGQWVFHRPSTCVMGDPRIAAPGYRGGHDDRSTTMMADAIRITIQEALTLQSFDPAYPVQGTKTKQFEQVGNAVPPRLAQAVLEAMGASERAVEVRPAATNSDNTQCAGTVSQPSSERALSDTACTHPFCRCPACRYWPNQTL